MKIAFDNNLGNIHLTKMVVPKNTSFQMPIGELLNKLARLSYKYCSKSPQLLSPRQTLYLLMGYLYFRISRAQQHPFFTDGKLIITWYVEFRKKNFFCILFSRCTSGIIRKCTCFEKVFTFMLIFARTNLINCYAPNRNFKIFVSTFFVPLLKPLHFPI